MNLNIHTYCQQAKDYEKVAHQFLSALQVEVANSLIKYHSPRYNNYLMPYEQNERAMDAVILPALARLCNGMVMTELRVNRKEKLKYNGRSETQNTIGRTDYWCIYKGYSFIIELKHCHESIKLDSCCCNTQKTWCTMIKQLQAIVNEVCAYEDKTAGVIRIGIQFVTLRVGKQTETLLKDFYQHPQRKFDTLQQYITNKDCKTAPNYQSMWIIPRNIVKDEQTERELTHRNVALMLVAHIYPTIKHKGCPNQN